MGKPPERPKGKPPESPLDEVARRVPSLICDPRPGAVEHAADFHALREAGEPLTLFWPGVAAGITSAAGIRPVADAAAWEAVLDDESIPGIAGVAAPPAWLPVADLDRILLVSAAADASHLTPSEHALVESLFAAGAEEVELVPPTALAELGQSWHSGRRAATPRLTRGQPSAAPAWGDGNPKPGRA